MSTNDPKRTLSTVVSPYYFAIFAPLVFGAGLPIFRPEYKSRRGDYEQGNSAHPSPAARELARSSTFIGWRPIAFELQFEPGFTEAYEWIHSASAQEELDSLCREARMLRYVDRHGPKAA
jgi:hypothetical protein